jgi:hypothetical protein
MELNAKSIAAFKFTGLSADGEAIHGHRLADGKGLHLHAPKVARYWRMNYRFSGQKPPLALGVYPAVGQADARMAGQDSFQNGGQ